MDGSYTDGDQTPPRSITDQIVDVLREDKGEFILLAGIAVFIIIGFRETWSLTLEESRYVPEIILWLMTIILILTVFMKFFGDAITDRIGISNAGTAYDDLLAEDESADDDEQLFEIRPLGVGIHFGWLVLYLLSMNYIGFWTTNIVFTIIYIMVNETSPLPRRFGYAIGWTILVVGILWILFVELLVVTAIWRFGFLP